MTDDDVVVLVVSLTAKRCSAWRSAIARARRDRCIGLSIHALSRCRPSRFRSVDQRVGFAIRCAHRFGWVWHGWQVSGYSERDRAACFIDACGVA